MSTRKRAPDNGEEQSVHTLSDLPTEDQSMTPTHLMVQTPRWSLLLPTLLFLGLPLAPSWNVLEPSFGCVTVSSFDCTSDVPWCEVSQSDESVKQLPVADSADALDDGGRDAGSGSRQNWLEEHVKCN